MSDEWTSEEEAPRAKGGLPKWVWWTCGLGCMGAVLLAVILGGLGFLAAKRMADPEAGKAKVLELLACDAWPEDYEVVTSAVVFGAGSINITWPEGMAILQVRQNQREFDRVMNPGSFDKTVTRITEVLEGEMELQGRQVATRNLTMFGQEFLRVDLSRKQGPFLALDLPAFDDPERSEASARSFLEPFDVWRER